MASIDQALDELVAHSVPDAKLLGRREAREILGGKPLDRIEALVAAMAFL